MPGGTEGAGWELEAAGWVTGRIHPGWIRLDGFYVNKQRLIKTGSELKEAG